MCINDNMSSLQTGLSFVVQWLSCVQHFATPWTATWQDSLSFTIFLNLLKLMSIVSVITSNHLIFYCPLLLLLSIFHSIRVFSNELALCIRWPKYWTLSFSSSNEYSGLISFRIDLFGLLAVQEILKSLLQHHSLKASILQHQPSLWSNSHIHTLKEFNSIEFFFPNTGQVLKYKYSIPML